MDPAFHLFNDSSDLVLPEKAHKLWLAGMTVKKRFTAQCWIFSQTLTLKHWLNILLGMMFHESAARIDAATPSTVGLWEDGHEKPPTKQ